MISDALFALILFAAKAMMIVLMVLLILLVFFGLLSRAKEKLKGHLQVKNLNHKYAEMTETILTETLPKKAFKQYLKDKKKAEKAWQTESEQAKHVYVLNFQGDLNASAVTSLREEITAILNVANQGDEVVLRLESAGGVVHGYGLAAAQLMRLRARNIQLTVTIDKMAASGGYMMACIANKILSAPFAIIGSIGVIVQLPNFHRLLKEKDIDFEQVMSGEYKRTLTLFGENTDAGRDKLQAEIETIHQQFKQLIAEHRQGLDINQVATGEHWLGQQALALNLVDELTTSDDYLLEQSKTAHLYEMRYEMKKSFLSKLTATARLTQQTLRPFLLMRPD